MGQVHKGSKKSIFNTVGTRFIMALNNMKRQDRQKEPEEESK